MRYKLLAVSAAALIAAIALPAMPAKADPAIGVAVSAPITPITLGVGAAVVLVANEAFAERPFGPNGEIMKIISVPVKIVDGNVKGSGRESGELAKVLRATIGISVRDIEKYGILGGPNSVMRKPFG
jgi:hypothetical protein